MEGNNGKYNPSEFKDCGYNCPVEQVSWNDVQDFINRLNQKTKNNPQAPFGKGEFRLPTEAEWEYAAREGGGKVRFGTGTDRISSDIANFDASAGYEQDYSDAGEYRKKTTPVGSFRPNSLGIYDMSGNVWQWCNDWYDSDYYKNSPKDNPKGPSSGSNRVLRGGDWRYYASRARAAFREGVTPGGRGYDLGFRLAGSR